MNKSSLFGWHTLSIASIFVLGSAVMNLPQKGADEFNFSAFLIMGMLLIGVYCLGSFLTPLLLKPRRSVMGKTIVCGFLSASAVYSLFCFAQSFKETVFFVLSVILPKTQHLFIVVVFGIIVVYFALKRQENVLKFALLSLVMVAAVILFFFLAAADKYDFRNIFIFRLPSLGELYEQIKPYVKNPLLPVLVLPLYFNFSLNGKNTREGVIGVAVGAVLLGLCVLMPLLLFGAELAGRLDFPFSSAVSTVTVGRLFTRLDGFSYFVYFVCSLIKITVCLFVVKASLNKISEILKSTE